jgi:hypothetical protein
MRQDVTVLILPTSLGFTNGFNLGGFMEKG